MHCLKAESKGLEDDQRRAGALLQLQERCEGHMNWPRGQDSAHGLVFDTCGLSNRGIDFRLFSI